MRTVLTALAVVTCAALTAGAADDEKYTSKDGKFAVQFPKGAKVTTETQKNGGLDMKVAKVADGADKKFIVMYVDLPDAAKNAPAKTLLDAIEAGMVKTSGGKLDGSKDFESGKGKYPGRELLVDKDGAKTKARLVLVETRAYIVIVGGPKEFATEKDATAFLDSFEVTK